MQIELVALVALSLFISFRRIPTKDAISRARANLFAARSLMLFDHGAGKATDYQRCRERAKRWWNIASHLAVLAHRHEMIGIVIFVSIAALIQCFVFMLVFDGVTGISLGPYALAGQLLLPLIVGLLTARRRCGRYVTWKH
jgi:hypothetical protein